MLNFFNICVMLLSEDNFQRFASILRMMLIFPLNSVRSFHTYGIVYQGFGPAQFSFPIAPRSGKHNRIRYTINAHWVSPSAKGDPI